jgi:hypothetical protein
MRHRLTARTLTVLSVLFGTLIFAPELARAHCDTMDGPVVKAAQSALAKGNVNLILIWVQKEDEAQVKQRFRQTLAVRRLSREARELAESYFFETVVRLHRAGEGEPYTGLQPAGTDLGPVIPLADKAIRDGSAGALLKLFAAPARTEILTRFNDVMAKKSFGENDVEAGREFVKAYVAFLHHVEHLHEEGAHT